MPACTSTVVRPMIARPVAMVRCVVSGRPEHEEREPEQDQRDATDDPKHERQRIPHAGHASTAPTGVGLLPLPMSTLWDTPTTLPMSPATSRISTARAPNPLASLLAIIAAPAAVGAGASGHLPIRIDPVAATRAPGSLPAPPRPTARGMTTAMGGLPASGGRPASVSMLTCRSLVVDRGSDSRRR
jgi:hypothetical protein